MNLLGWLHGHPHPLKTLLMGSVIAGALGLGLGIGLSGVHPTPALALTCPSNEVGSPWGCVAAPNGTGTITVESSGSSSGGAASTSGSTTSGSTRSGNSNSGTSTSHDISVCTGSECALTSSYTNTATGDESVGDGQYTHDSCASEGEIVAFNGSTAYCSTNGCAGGQEDVDGVCQDLNGSCSSGGIYPQWTFSSCANGIETETSHNTCTDATTGTSTIACTDAATTTATTTPTTTVHHTTTTGGGTTTTTQTTAPTLGCPSGETLQMKNVTTPDCTSTTTYVSTGCHRTVASSREECTTTSYACTNCSSHWVGGPTWDGGHYVYSCVRATCHSQSCHSVPLTYRTVCTTTPETTQTCTPVTTPEQVCAAPACTVGAVQSCGPVVLTGCASAGSATGYQDCTTTTTSAACTTSSANTNVPVTEASSTTCQTQVQHQCAPDQPGYAERQTCLTAPAGGLTDCSGWSTPYYDPQGCPVPTPVD